MSPLQQAQWLRGEQIYDIPVQQNQYFDLIKQDPRCIREVPPRLLTQEMIMYVIGKTIPPAPNNLLTIWVLDYLFNLPKDQINFLLIELLPRISVLLTLKGYENVSNFHPLFSLLNNKNKTSRF